MIWCKFWRLVELVRNDRVLDEKLEGDDAEGVLVSRFENDGTGCSGLLDFEPAGGADAPAVAGFEAGKAELGHGSREIVAERLRGSEKGLIDDAADGVDANVVGTGVATAIPEKAGHRLAAANSEGLPEDVSSEVFDGFGIRH
jgi:hypothetical protein